ncbi:MAG: hypothetical protein WBB82_05300 [Limnothrix sp.]
MFFDLLYPSTNYQINCRGFAHVTKEISFHEWGQVKYLGRYYQAQLHDPEEYSLPIGLRVIVYVDRGFALFVGMDPYATRPMPHPQELLAKGKIPVFS